MTPSGPSFLSPFTETTMPTLHLKSIAVVTALALITGGCATTPGPGTSGSDQCNVAQSAVAGAVIGAVLGGMIGGQRGALQGAALGTAGSVGICLVMNVQSRQVKTAAQSDADYRRTVGSLPATPRIVSYTPSLNTANVPRGQPLVITSVVEIVNGSQEPIREVREELLLFDRAGQRFQETQKPASLSAGGRYVNSFSIDWPAQVPPGIYTAQTRVSVNGKILATRDQQFRLAAVDMKEAGTAVAMATH